MTTPVCHPDRVHHARGLCPSCYDHERKYGELPDPPQPRWHRTAALVERAERLKAELEAAGDYAPIPATWDGVAEYLGVRPETLDRYRYRVREYRAREAS